MKDQMVKVCQYLGRSRPAATGDIAAHLWPTRNTGDGDIVAVLLLGGMKAKGLVCSSKSDGSTIWELTSLGGEVCLAANTRDAARAQLLATEHEVYRAEQHVASAEDDLERVLG